MAVKKMIQLLDMLDVSVEAFAQLSGLTVDDIHAISSGASEPNARAACLLRIMRNTGAAKLKPIIKEFERRETPQRWRQAHGFSRYEVSASGLARRRVSGSRGIRVLKPKTLKGGYHGYTFYDDSGSMKSVSAHRMVALTWIGPPPFDGAMVCHKDGNPVNNSVENLYWGSAQDNTRDSVKHGTNSFTNPAHFAQNPHSRQSIGSVRRAHKLGIINKDQALKEIESIRQKGT